MRKGIKRVRREEKKCLMEEEAGKGSVGKGKREKYVESGRQTEKVFERVGSWEGVWKGKRWRNLFETVRGKERKRSEMVENELKSKSKRKRTSVWERKRQRDTGRGG